MEEEINIENVFDQEFGHILTGRNDYKALDTLLEQALNSDNG